MERLTQNNATDLERATGLAMVKDTAKGSARERLERADIRMLWHLTLVIGRGVFATQDIPARSIVDTSPVIVMPLKDLDALKVTLLDHYT